MSLIAYIAQILKYIILYLILWFLLLTGNNCLAQENCVVPESPVLKAVTVDPATGIVNLNWDLSPSSNIAAYVVYTYDNGVGLPVDTIWNPLATSYSHVTTATKYFSVSYVVAAHRMPNCTSPLSNHLNTIFNKAKIDTCNKKITLTWNKYLSVPYKVTGYSIMASVNGSPYSEIAEVSPDSAQFTFNDFITDSELCFIIQANLEQGTISKSNIDSLSTEMQRPPDWINADYATVKDNKVSLSFTVDQSSEISEFILERKTGTSGSFTEISRPVSYSGNIKYTDDKADAGLVNIYRLSAINACDKPITVSNLASNIVLSLEKVNNDILLKWNRYKYWNGEVSSYQLLANTGGGYTRISDVNPSDSSVLVDYRDLMYEITGYELCFEIRANEVLNPYGISGSSISQEACTEPLEIITVPDVFTPNNDLVNDLFRPVLSFTPKDYILIISNRQGKTIFETKDFRESWDGTENGKAVAQGVFLWFLRVTTPSGKSVSRTGTVAVYFNR